MRAYLSDLSHAIRSLSRARAYAATVIVVLALGIGANSAMFSLVDAVLFRELPVDHPDQLVRIFRVSSSGQLGSFSLPSYDDLREHIPTLRIAAFRDDMAVHLSLAQGGPERVSADLVSGSYFQVLGVSAQVGRVLAPDDDRAAGAGAVAVISDRLWRTRFGADRSVIGSAVRINTRTFVIVGVAAPGFTGVSMGTTPDVWVPMTMVADVAPELVQFRPLSSRGLHWLEVIGRLTPGTTAQLVQSQAGSAVASEAGQLAAGERPPTARVIGLTAAVIDPRRTDQVDRLSWLLLAATGLVLLIACVDAAGLLLARAERRSREIATRLALGATRVRITREIVLESVILSLGGAIAGLWLASWLTDFVAATVPAGFSIPVDAALPMLGRRSLVFTGAVALLVGVLFSFAPALRQSTADLASALRGRGTTAGRSWLRGALVSQQIALSLVLIIGAGLLLRTMANSSRTELGFEPEHVVAATIDPSRSGYADADRRRVLFAELRSRLMNVPGFQSVALAAAVPVGAVAFTNSLEVTGYTPAPNENPEADVNIVTPDFFRTLGIPLQQGRDFTDADRQTTGNVVIVNRALTDRYWPGREPLQQRIVNFDSARVVGVVQNVRWRSLREPAVPMIWVPMQQFSWSSATIVVRTSLSDDAALRAIGRVVAGLDRSLLLMDPGPLRANVRNALARERLLAGLLGAFALLALVLSAAGLYGVMSYVMESRTREWGVRMALGARARDVLLQVEGRALRLAAIGLGTGIVAALLLTRALGRMLYGVAPNDLGTYAAAAGILLAVSLLAGWLPARRATRVDPMAAMRTD